MWLCLNNAFLSVVSKTPKSKTLLVRARRRGDIERVFPGAKVVTIPGRDYQFRADIDRKEVAAKVAEMVMGISYPNFKGSVTQEHDDLHHAYMKVWHVMADLQEIPPYGTHPRGKKQGPDLFGDLD